MINMIFSSNQIGGGEYNLYIDNLFKLKILEKKCMTLNIDS